MPNVNNIHPAVQVQKSRAGCERELPELSPCSLHKTQIEEFADSVMKKSTRNRPYSDTIYQGTVITPYVKGISEQFRHIGNRLNLRTIFKTKHTLRGTLMKTEPVRDAHQTKKYVYSIPCDCSRCYIGETSRFSDGEVCVQHPM
jgi:hypothetical protein